MESELEIRKIVEERFVAVPHNRGTAKYFKNHYPEVVKWLREYYGVDDSYTVSGLCYCLVHGLKDVPRCPCGGRVRFKGFVNGFGQYCSEKCRYADKEAQERAKKARDATMMSRYGVKNMFLLPEAQEKAKKTKLEKYGDEWYSNHAKARRTCLERYGSETPGGSVIIKERIKKTMRDRYGAESAFSVDAFKRKSIATMRERYGVDYAAQNKDIYEKVKITNRERYGHDCVFQNEEIIEKTRNTNIEKYGVERYSQTRDYHIRRRHQFHSRYNDTVGFYSTWEAMVYDFCLSHGVTPVMSPCSLPYVVDGVTHMYIPDFLINGHLVEVKGDQYINKDDGSWILPYANWNVSAEEYEDLKKRAKAKSECAKENNVVIISSKEIHNLEESILPLLGTVGAGLPPPSLKTYGINQEKVLEMCFRSEFPGSLRWPKDDYIWDCNCRGRKSPRTAWSSHTLIRQAVANMFRFVKRAFLKGTEPEFVMRHEEAFRAASEGNEAPLMRLVLARFTIGRIAPKVTALPKGLFLEIANSSGIDLSSGVYCPMAGFGGIIAGAKQWFKEHKVDPAGKIEAFDINPNLCKQYGWKCKDVLSDYVETDKVVVACPPFADTERWPGTPDEMYKSFDEWARLIREHVKAPRYILIGPITAVDKSRPEIYGRTKQARYYPEYSYPL